MRKLTTITHKRCINQQKKIAENIKTLNEKVAAHINMLTHRCHLSYATYIFIHVQREVWEK